MTPLERLAAAIEAGTAEHDDFCTPWHNDGLCVEAQNAYDGSLDAAKALHDAVLPGWFWFGGHLNGPADGYSFTIAENPYPDMPSFRAFDEIPARAWLLAIVRALIEQETKE